MARKLHNELFEVVYPCATTDISFTFMNRDNLDFIAEQIWHRGLAAYEAPTPGLVVSLCQGGAHQCGTHQDGAHQGSAGAVLDVGANTGIFSLLAAASNPRAAVFAFEPLAHVRQVLEANLELNPSLSPRIQVHACALSNTIGSARFFETVNDQGFLTTSSSLEISHARSMDHGKFLDGEVETITLDAWAERHLGDRRLGLIKIDVETHEYAVIEGGGAVIARHRPMIILEVLPGAEVGPIQQMIDKERYLVFSVTRTALRQSFRLHYSSDATNHLLCPAEQVERVFRLLRQHMLSLELD